MDLQSFSESKNCSLPELSNKSKISLVYLYELNRGAKKNPSLKVTKAIAQALKASIEEIDEVLLSCCS